MVIVNILEDKASNGQGTSSFHSDWIIKEVLCISAFCKSYLVRFGFGQLTPESNKCTLYPPCTELLVHWDHFSIMLARLGCRPVSPGISTLNPAGNVRNLTVRRSSGSKAILDDIPRVGRW